MTLPKIEKVQKLYNYLTKNKDELLLMYSEYKNWPYVFSK